jgi:hypothetical protein
MTSLANNELGFSDTEMEEFFSYLDDLRAEGVTNMFGAAPYLVDEFVDLTKSSARKVLAEWMRTYAERHPQ